MAPSTVSPQSSVSETPVIFPSTTSAPGLSSGLMPSAPSNGDTPSNGGLGPDGGTSDAAVAVAVTVLQPC